MSSSKLHSKIRQAGGDTISREAALCTVLRRFREPRNYTLSLLPTIL